MNPSLVLVMAAGHGTRMRSSVPKVMHPVCGRPMVAWPIRAARDAGAERVAAIVSPRHDLSGALPDGTETVVQHEADGTGGAVRAAADLIRDASQGRSLSVVVLSGDGPLVSAGEVSALLARHAEAGADATIATTELDDPGSFGRIIRDEQGRVLRVAEAKATGDASPEELSIREVNTGIYAFDAAALLAALDQLSNDNAQGEYYLPDVLPAIRESGGIVEAHRVADAAAMLGVNDRVDLARVEGVARARILEGHMRAGVTVTDPGSTWVEADVVIEPDVILHPGTSLRGRTYVAGGAEVGPMTTAVDAAIGERAKVLRSHLDGCAVGAGCSVGPFAYLRPGTRLEEGAKAGTFVELKNSVIGKGAKVPHLAYVGDATVGDSANLGAGTITANYDGFRKHRTVIGEGARLGVDTMLIAPVEIGAGAYTGGGSVISKDVPSGALGITRSQQKNIDGYADHKAATARQEEDS